MFVTQCNIKVHYLDKFYPINDEINLGSINAISV